MAELNQKKRPIQLKSPDKQYTIPYDDVNGSDIFDMLKHMANFNNMSRHLHNDNIETYKRFFEKLYAKYKVFLYRWLRKNWDSLSEERQNFAKPYYRKGRMVL
ncbi:MAG: hypothetical protein FWC89_05000 [Defluviitaleaceae bacterium]|nr:hypothetical protein [Defluviitaleaceae bacterium]